MILIIDKKGMYRLVHPFLLSYKFQANVSLVIICHRGWLQYPAEPCLR